MCWTTCITGLIFTIGVISCAVFSTTTYITETILTHAVFLGISLLFGISQPKYLLAVLVITAIPAIWLFFYAAATLPIALIFLAAFIAYHVASMQNWQRRLAFLASKHVMLVTRLDAVLPQLATAQLAPTIARLLRDTGGAVTSSKVTPIRFAERRALRLLGGPTVAPHSSSESSGEPRSSFAAAMPRQSLQPLQTRDSLAATASSLLLRLQPTPTSVSKPRRPSTLQLGLTQDDSVLFSKSGKALLSRRAVMDLGRDPALQARLLHQSTVSPAAQPASTRRVAHPLLQGTPVSPSFPHALVSPAGRAGFPASPVLVSTPATHGASPRSRAATTFALRPHWSASPTGPMIQGFASKCGPVAGAVLQGLPPQVMAHLPVPGLGDAPHSTEDATPKRAQSTGSLLSRHDAVAAAAALADQAEDDQADIEADVDRAFSGFDAVTVLSGHSSSTTPQSSLRTHGSRAAPPDELLLPAAALHSGSPARARSSRTGVLGSTSAPLTAVLSPSGSASSPEHSSDSRTPDMRALGATLSGPSQANTRRLAHVLSQHHITRAFSHFVLMASAGTDDGYGSDSPQPTATDKQHTTANSHWRASMPALQHVPESGTLTNAGTPREDSVFSSPGVRPAPSTAQDEPLMLRDLESTAESRSHPSQHDMHVEHERAATDDDATWPASHAARHAVHPAPTSHRLGSLQLAEPQQLGLMKPSVAMLSHSATMSPSARRSKRRLRPTRRTRSGIFVSTPGGVGTERGLGYVYHNTSVVFAHISQFHDRLSHCSDSQLAQCLHELHSRMDAAVERAGLFKACAVAHIYMAVAGVPTPSDDQIAQALQFALSIAANVRDHPILLGGKQVQLQLGIACGPVAAGVIGSRSWNFHVFGDVVNTASRMASCSEPGMVQLTAGAARELKQLSRSQDAPPWVAGLRLRSRGNVPVKGKGLMQTYFAEQGEVRLPGRADPGHLPSWRGSSRLLQRVPSARASFTGVVRVPIDYSKEPDVLHDPSKKDLQLTMAYDRLIDLLDLPAGASQSDAIAVDALVWYAHQLTEGRSLAPDAVSELESYSLSPRVHWTGTASVPDRPWWHRWRTSKQQVHPHVGHALPNGPRSAHDLLHPHGWHHEYSRVLLLATVGVALAVLVNAQLDKIWQILVASGIMLQILVLLVRRRAFNPAHNLLSKAVAWSSALLALGLLSLVAAYCTIDGRTAGLVALAPCVAGSITHHAARAPMAQGVTAAAALVALVMPLSISQNDALGDSSGFSFGSQVCVYACVLILSLAIAWDAAQARRAACITGAVVRSQYRTAERLLSNVLPTQQIAKRYLRGEPILDTLFDTCMLFADIKDFTPLCVALRPEELIRLLDVTYSAFDLHVDAHGLVKLDTIGDAIVVLGGMPNTASVANPQAAVLDFAHDMMESLVAIREKLGIEIYMRAGAHSEPRVLGGVLGKLRPRFMVWGEGIEAAQVLEEMAAPGGLMVSDSVMSRVSPSEIEVLQCGLHLLPSGRTAHIAQVKSWRQRGNFAVRDDLQTVEVMEQ